MIEIKNILCDLLDHAYPESDKLNQYKRFYIEISDKNLKSLHGKYTPTNHHIKIYNLYRNDAAVIATTIHELSHHVDWCNRNNSDHSAEFYQVFRKLLYTALDMSLFTKEEYLQATKDASDSRKIEKMISSYTPSDIGYKKNCKKIVVSGGYEFRDFLKAHKFTFNHINKTWEIEVNEDQISLITTLLDNKCIEYDVEKAGSMSFKKDLYLAAVKGSYDVKDILKNEGFLFDSKKKCWKKPVRQEDAEKTLNHYATKMPTVSFKII